MQITVCCAAPVTLEAKLQVAARLFPALQTPCQQGLGRIPVPH